MNIQKVFETLNKYKKSYLKYDDIIIQTDNEFVYITGIIERDYEPNLQEIIDEFKIKKQ